MRFDLTRLDGDETYAPGRVVDRGTPWWRPHKGDIKAGYAFKGEKLKGDALEQAARCRVLTRDLIYWRNGQPKIQPFCWGWAIARYKSDEFSGIHGVKSNTRKQYLWLMARWEDGIGGVMVKDTDFARLKMWQTLMVNRGRSSSYIHRMFTMLRTVANHGRLIEPTVFRDVCDILSAMKIEAPKPKQTAPTAEQVHAVIAAADAAGDAMFALGLSLQWWLAIRAVDVRGLYEDDRKANRWGDGLTWDMIDLDRKTIRKVESKTRRSDGRARVWDLSPLPDLVARIEAIPTDQRVGPVLRGHEGMPFTKRHYADLFRQYADAAGVPKHVKAMDIRAAALNDALQHGANGLEVQHAAGHASFSTTERYIRSRDTSAQKVIQLRAAKTA